MVGKDEEIVYDEKTNVRSALFSCRYSSVSKKNRYTHYKKFGHSIGFYWNLHIETNLRDREGQIVQPRKKVMTIVGSLGSVVNIIVEKFAAEQIKTL